MKKIRADIMLFEQGLAPSREQAQRLIMAGKVCWGDPPQSVQKPGQPLAPGTALTLTGQERFVSRGAYKLLTALEAFPALAMAAQNAVALDAGASTGGFTDCLLQHGAARVYAVDVGHAQLHEKMRAHPGVISLEGVNLRNAPPELIPEPIDMLVADVSFISLTRILPACLQWLKPGAYVIALIKPQFEVGPHQTTKGVVRDENLRQQAVDSVLAFCQNELNLNLMGVLPAAIKGPKGNQEYLACWTKGER